MEEIWGRLEKYFVERDDVLMAFLFGSQAKGLARSESDIDIAVYFKTQSGEMDFESDSRFESEDKIWLDLEKLLGKKVDLVILNRAAASVAFAAVNSGKEICVKDSNIRTKFILLASAVAEEMRDFARDFLAIKARSASLSETDRARLLRLVDFLEGELTDYKKFTVPDQLEYQNNRGYKRELERWAENIINSSIDIAKIMVGSEKKDLPETYRLTLAGLASLEGFEKERAESLAGFAKIRNILAHEYLDIRFSNLKRFAENSEADYRYLADFTKKFADGK